MAKIPQYLRLKDNHPTMIKLMKLYDLADELKIQLSFHGQTMIVEDGDRDPNLPHLRLEDLESGDAPGEWPPGCEFKVIYENPAYLEEQAKEQEEYRKKRAEEEKARAEALARKRKEEEEKRAKEIEESERFLLAKLKAKYEP
jgi:hypothetical protein